MARIIQPLGPMPLDGSLMGRCRHSALALRWVAGHPLSPMVESLKKGLGTLLRSLIDQLDGEVQRLYDDLGLDYRPRFTPIVRHLEAYGPSTIRAIQRSVGVSHSAISQTIAQMHKAGLVQRSQGEDARERIVALSDEARRLLPLLHDCWMRADAATVELSGELDVDLEELLLRALRLLDRRPLGERMARPSSD